jgi:hypothetical protein
VHKLKEADMLNLMLRMKKHGNKWKIADSLKSQLANSGWRGTAV